MSDLVGRLRAEATDNRRYEVSGTLATEAADRIEQLEAALRVIQKLPNVKSHYGTQITEMIDAALEGRT